MIKILFTATQIKELQYERFHHPHPRVQRKMDALLLKSQGLDHETIAKITNICTNTLRAYFKQYQTGGIDALKLIKFYKPLNVMTPYTTTITKHFQDNPCSSVKQACHEIQKLTGIKRKVSHVRKYLHDIGLKPRRTAAIPAKADHDKQARFHDEQLMPRLEEAKNHQRTVYFIDAAHFVHAAFLGILWCFARVFIKSPSGRERFNVLGAINAVTNKLITVTNTSYINAQSVCELMIKIAAQHTGIVTLVLDNAKYQKCKLVTELAAKLGLELLYLPPYSPNLNIIERLWKYTKKQCLYSKYYDNFNTFKQAITHCLEHLDEHDDELATLLNLKFQDLNPNRFEYTAHKLAA